MNIDIQHIILSTPPTQKERFNNIIEICPGTNAFVACTAGQISVPH